MKHLALLPVLALSFVAGCAAGSTNTGAQACECKLVGRYYLDSRNFCPSHFNAETIGFYLQALEEPTNLASSAPPLKLEERLAVNYDAYWQLRRVIGVNPPGLGVILFMLGCEKEFSISDYRLAGMRNSARLWGELGVAEHVVGNYEESERAFDNALQLEPNYFANRPIQKRIAEAARARRPFTP